MEEKPKPLRMSDSVEKVGEHGQLVEERAPADSSYLSMCLAGFCFPCYLCCSWFTVTEQEEAVVLEWGKYAKTVKTAGLHFSNCFGRELRRVSKQKRSADLPATKVVDKNGNPLNVSGIIVFQYVDSKRCAIDVQNADVYVYTQAQAAMKQIVSQFPYENLLDIDNLNVLCLKRDAPQISEHLVRSLQEKVGLAGAEILSFDFNEIGYAPEIAHGMLKRQLAMATLAARKTIVEGAVEITYGALAQLEHRGIDVSPVERAKLASNLLTVICSDSKDVQPQFSVDHHHARHAHIPVHSVHQQF